MKIEFDRVVSEGDPENEGELLRIVEEPQRTFLSRSYVPVGIALFTIIVSMGMMWQKRSEWDRTWASMDVSRIARAVGWYYHEFDALPPLEAEGLIETLQGVARAGRNDKQGPYAYDGWTGKDLYGNVIKVFVRDGSVVARSFGPNGIDDSGIGDDIDESVRLLRKSRW